MREVAVHQIYSQGPAAPRDAGAGVVTRSREENLAPSPHQRIMMDSSSQEGTAYNGKSRPTFGDCEGAMFSLATRLRPTRAIRLPANDCPQPSITTRQAGSWTRGTKVEWP